jgi:hypothetical protein
MIKMKKTMKQTMKKTVKKSSGRGGSRKCKVMKDLPVPSQKYLDAHKNVLVCADNKCKEFLDKDIAINEKCLDKTINMKFSDHKRMEVEDACHKKLGLVPNTMDKIKCMNKRCPSEVKKFQKIPFTEHNPEAIRDFSDFEREKYRLQQKREKAYPELVKIAKLNKKNQFIDEAIIKCKSESEKKKLKKRRDKIYTEISKFYAN